MRDVGAVVAVMVLDEDFDQMNWVGGTNLTFAPNSSASGALTNQSSVTWVVTVGMLVMTSTNSSPRVIRLSQRSSTVSTAKPWSRK